MIHFDQSHNEFVAYLREEDRAQSTILAYGKDIEQMLQHTHAERNKTHVHQIETEDIKAFLKSLEEQNYTKKSISRKINSIKTFFRFLKIREYVTEDPAAVISHPKFETPPPRILSETEYRALRDAARGDTRTFAIIELLLQTGIRIGELANIRMGDIKTDQEDTSILQVPESRTTRERDIPLNQAAVQAVQSYLHERPDSSDDHLFVTRTGNPLLVRNIRASIDRYFDKAGIENVKVNDLRHTWIAHHIKHGASLMTISKLAGHKRLATTEKYLDHVQAASEEKPELDQL